MDVEQQQAVATFVSITGADETTAEHVLDAHGWDLERSIDFFLETGFQQEPAFGAGSFAVPNGDVEQPHFAPREAEDVIDLSEVDRTPQDAFVTSLPEPVRGTPARARPPASSSQPLIEEPEDDYHNGVQAISDDDLNNVPVYHIPRGRRQGPGRPMSSDDEDGKPMFGIPPLPGWVPAELAGPSTGRVRRNRPGAARVASADDLRELHEALGRRLGPSAELDPADLPAPARPRRSGLRSHDVRFDDEDDDEPNLPAGINVEEARMLEAAMLGIPYNGHVPDFTAGLYGGPAPLPVSDEVLQQRMLREEQDSEYLASLQADMEKAQAEENARRQAAEETMRAREAAESEERRLREEAAAYSALIAAKEGRLPQEPAVDVADTVNVVVRMPDGSRLGRRFGASDPVQALFDFIDVSSQEGVKAGSYNLITQFPRRVLKEGDPACLRDVGLSGRQEALFLEPIS